MKTKTILDRPEYYPPAWPKQLSGLTLNPKRLRVGDRDGWVCQLCKHPIEWMYQATIDHIVPKSKGGSDNLSNLQIAHGWCNHAKGNRTHEIPMMKPVSPAPKIEGVNHVAALWNEIAVHKFDRLSYNLFESYFKRYAASITPTPQPEKLPNLKCVDGVIYSTRK